jgi:cupin superfamily acireductone dioxygenase involved in methionine salvage
MKKLYKLIIKTYTFGVKYYDLFVLADNESDMLRMVSKYLTEHYDNDPEILTYTEIDLNDNVSKVL